MSLYPRAVVRVAPVAGLALGAADLPTPDARADLVLDIAQPTIVQDTQATLVVTVAGGDLVTDGELYLQVNDGGAAVGGTDTLPPVTAVDFSTGLFAQENAVAQSGFDPAQAPLAPAFSIFGRADLTGIPADGTVAVVTLDTSGLAVDDTIDLRLFVLDRVADDRFDTFFSFNGTPVTTEPVHSVFSLTVIPVPEPASAAALAVVLGLGLATRRRR